MRIKPRASGGLRLYDGVLPSVTEILKILEKDYLNNWRNKVGAQEADRVLRNAAAFGTRIHTIAQQIALGQYKPGNSDVAPYAAAVREFLDTHVAQVLETEMTLVSPRLRYGGTLDLYCQLKDNSRAVVDWKTSRQLTREHNAQSAAYALLLREHGYQVNKRLIVRIKKNDPGEYYVRTCKEHQADVELFLACKELWWCVNRRKMAKLDKKKSA